VATRGHHGDDGHGRPGVVSVPSRPARCSWRAGRHLGRRRRVLEAYDQRLSLLPGARESVQTLAKQWPLGLASSSNRAVIEVFLERSGLRGCFRAVVSSEEVAHGKPAPDVYLAAVEALAVEPHTAVAVEDSSNGIRAASAAGTRVVAIPNRTVPPPADVLALADAVVASLTDLTPDLVTRLAGGRQSEPPDR
jgi:HAD superfamily hydrolase (TIGR01509 family)